MDQAEEVSLQLNWPWHDRNRGLSWLKAGAFALMFVPALWMLYQLGTGQFGPVPLGGMTYWSGLWATVLLLLALAVTPAVTILRWGRLIVVRRMIGVTALAYTVAHIVIYFALRFWDFVHIAHEMASRLSLILATIATLGLIALGATSLDAAVARMGARGWQRLHNAIYAISALVLVHYLLSPGIFPDQYLTCGAFFWLMAWRLVNRRGRGTDVVTLVALAVGSCVFTMFLEAAWIWAYHDYEPLQTLSNNLSLELGLAPAWKILGLGLAFAFAAAFRQGARPRAASFGVHGSSAGLTSG